MTIKVGDYVWVKSPGVLAVVLRIRGTKLILRLLSYGGTEGGFIYVEGIAVVRDCTEVVYIGSHLTEDQIEAMRRVTS